MDEPLDTDASASSPASPIVSPPSHNLTSSLPAESKEDVDMVTVPPDEEEDVAANESAAADDVSMKGTGEIDLSETTNPAPVAAPPLDTQIRTIESLVKAFRSAEPQEGTATYLVSRRWLSQAQAIASGDTAAFAQDEPEGTLGPVDNSDIVVGLVPDVNGNMAARLKPGLGEESFEYFSKEAWDLIVSWHGLAQGQLPIVRYAHNTSPDNNNPNIQFELHPPVFRIHRLHSVASPFNYSKEIPDLTQPVPTIMCSSSYNIMAFIQRAKTLLHIPMNRTIRLWRIPRKLPASDSLLPEPPAPASSLETALSTPPDSPPRTGDKASSSSMLNPQDAWSEMLLEVNAFKTLEPGVEREQLDVKDLSHDPNYNGKRTLAFSSLTVDQTLVLDENIERHIFVSGYTPKLTGKGKAKTTENGSANKTPVTSSTTLFGPASATAVQASAASSGRSSPSHSGPVTRGRTKTKSGRTRGCVGLSNLGNSCYMNAALQCIRSVEELTKYFLVHENESEINHNNPLGYGGNVANAYAYLLEEIYRENVPMSISPRQFKSTIGRYAQAFAGYGQQDSQEFLGFLLDGLQEDLSRIKKKPYIPKPDSTDEMIKNPAAIRELAEKVWDITKRRDDSIIADLFTGMYKSTLICPVCQKVSITFDPFTTLALPLPVQSVWSKTVRVIPLNDSPVSMDVELDKTSSVRAFKDFVGVRVDIPSERLICAQLVRENIVRIFDDFECVSEELTSHISIAVFEVESAPSNYAGTRKTTSMLYPERALDTKDVAKSGLSNEHLLVPVVHRFDPSFDTGYRRRYGKAGSLACPSHFIVLTPEEATSEDVIRRKILEKIASYSTWPEFTKAELVRQPPSMTESAGSDRSADDTPNGTEATEASDATETTDGDLVVTSASDADSAGSNKVVAKSVEGEDDLVDVTMNDAEDASSEAADPSKVLHKFNHSRPKWVTDTNMYLAGELQNLFDMGYYNDSSNVIPIRWPSTSDEKLYPRLRSRVPKPPVSKTAPAEDEESEESAEDSEDELSRATAEESVTRMADESDDEDGPISANQRRQRLKRSSSSHLRQMPNNEDDNDTDNEVESFFDTPAPATVPLIQLGEGIIVDWNPDGWDAVFGREGPGDHMRGQPTYDEPIPVIDDPELQERRRNRLSRKKRGLTLDECLDEFEREEILSENDQWYCPRCKELRRASKKFDLWKTPDILVVHLKRFSSSGWRRDKLDMRVDFPVEDLDITRRVLDKQTGKLEVYDLIGVDDHWGGLGGGHYTAFAKNFFDQRWYEYNDSSVSSVANTDRVVSAAAYLLFYRRRSDVPLGGPRFLEIEEKFQRLMSSSDEEDTSDAGEDQRLDTGSTSYTGSSSALKGAGARPEAGAARRRRASPGLASSGASSSTLNANGGGVRLGSPSGGEDDDDPDDEDYRPRYGTTSVVSRLASGTGVRSSVRIKPLDIESAHDYDDSVGDAASYNASGILNFGESRFGDRPSSSSGGFLHADDHSMEGLESSSFAARSAGLSTSPWNQQPWAFDKVDNNQSIAAADDDDSGVRIQPAIIDGDDLGHDPDRVSFGPMIAMGSSLGFANDVEDDDREALLPDSDTSAPPQPSHLPEPDAITQANMEDIRDQAWARKVAESRLVHMVHASDVDQDAASDKAVDIHVSEGDTAKMDEE